MPRTWRGKGGEGDRDSDGKTVGIETWKEPEKTGE